MDNDIRLAINIIRRSMCVHVEAVRSVAVLEYDPNKRSSGRTHLSSDPIRREKQYRFLNWSAVSAFGEAGISWQPARVSGRWLEPYRRKIYSESVFPELKRLNHILSRVRLGILETLAFDSAGGSFETPEGYSLAMRLFKALASWNYPVVAEIAEKHPLVREGLEELFGVTDVELIAMVCLDGDEWQSFGNDEERFDAYYQVKCTVPASRPEMMSCPVSDQASGVV